MAKQKSTQGIHLYKTKSYVNKSKTGAHLWYWHLIARNGRILARSSETYNSKQAAVKSIIAVAGWFGNNHHYYDCTNKNINLVVFYYGRLG